MDELLKLRDAVRAAEADAEAAWQEWRQARIAAEKADARVQQAENHAKAARRAYQEYVAAMYREVEG